MFCDFVFFRQVILEKLLTISMTFAQLFGSRNPRKSSFRWEGRDPMRLSLFYKNLYLRKSHEMKLFRRSHVCDCLLPINVSRGSLPSVVKAKFHYADFHQNFSMGKVVDTNHESRRRDLCCGLVGFHDLYPRLITDFVS